MCAILEPGRRYYATTLVDDVRRRWKPILVDLTTRSSVERECD
jgi:hypothetical protein